MVMICIAAATGIVGAVNWTFVISVGGFCLAAMATLIKIYGTKKKVEVPDEALRKSDYIKAIDDGQKEAGQKMDTLKDIIHENKSEVDLLKLKVEHSDKTLEELKQSNRDLYGRLDDLIKQILDWVNS